MRKEMGFEQEQARRWFGIKKKQNSFNLRRNSRGINRTNKINE